MSEENPTTQELRTLQGEREESEREQAAQSTEEREALTHERRAERAKYLKEKLFERAPWVDVGPARGQHRAVAGHGN